MIDIRPAKEEDAAELCELGRRTFSETFATENSAEDMELYLSKTFSPSLQLAEIRDPKRRVLIAWDGERAAGYSQLVAGPAESCVRGKNPIELLRLYVDQPWLGRGVGTLLMKHCLAIARAEGFKTLWLGVWERNFRAQTFYHKHGFAQVGSHVFVLGKDEQTDLILQRLL